MKTAIILHGMPPKEGHYNPEGDSQSNCHWFPWVQHELLLQDVLAQTPEMPVPYTPIAFNLIKNQDITVFISEDDDKEILDSVEIIKKEVSDVKEKRYKDQGHFTLGCMKTREFPDLRDEALS